MTKLRLVFAFFAFLLVLKGFAQVTMERTDEGVLIKEGSNNVFFYQTKPKAKEGKYLRNNYIHPLWGIDGNILTEDFPEDHLHQRGIFWAWHQIYIQGERVGDGWELKNYIQDINEIEFLINNKDQGVLKTEVYWKSDIWRNKYPYLKEKNTITIHPRQGKFRRIDFEINLQAMVEGVSIGGSEDEKGYGGFSVRIILPDGVVFTGEKGKIKPETNAIMAGQYINLSGAFAKKGKTGGIAIISSSENPDSPNSWILREKESMQNAKWPGRKTMKLSSSEPIVLKYSLIIYLGKLKEKKIRKFLN